MSGKYPELGKLAGKCGDSSDDNEATEGEDDEENYKGDTVYYPTPEEIEVARVFSTILKEQTDATVCEYVTLICVKNTESPKYGDSLYNIITTGTPAMKEFVEKYMTEVSTIKLSRYNKDKMKESIRKAEVKRNLSRYGRHAFDAVKGRWVMLYP
jgi:hypothetical protein